MTAIDHTGNSFVITLSVDEWDDENHGNLIGIYSTHQRAATAGANYAEATGNGFSIGTETIDFDGYADR
jgi:hypothetical protein